MPRVSIYLNGAFRGRSHKDGRFLIDRLPPGTYILRGRKLGYKASRLRFRAVAGETRRMRLTLRATDDPAELAYERGEQFREEKRYEPSLPHYRAALRWRRPFPQARLGLARSLLALNKFEAAERQARRAVQGNQGDTLEAYTVLGNILRGQGMYEEAVEMYRRALSQPDDVSPEAHTGLALALDDMGESEEAIEHMRKAIEQDGDGEPILYNLLGNMLLSIEANQEALEAFRKYLALAPESTLAPAIRSLAKQLRAELAAQP